MTLDESSLKGHRTGLGRIVLVSVLSVLVMVFCVQPTVADTSDIEQKVDTYLRPLLEEDLISGSILIARNGDILLAKGYGLANREYGLPNSPETKFRIGSMTKQFTAAAILILEQKELLSVGDSLGTFLPEYPQGGKITIHHLLTHTSGIPHHNEIPDYWEHAMQPLSIEEVVTLSRDLPLKFEPGSGFQYTNSGYVLLAHIIEKVSSMEYDEFLRENIFGPLGMNDTGLDRHTSILSNRATGHANTGYGDLFQAPYRDMPFTSGAGALYSTVMDLHTWDRALYGEGLLADANKQVMFTPDQRNYAYGWFVSEEFGRRLIEHRGAINGFLGQIKRFVDDDVLVVALLNYESTFSEHVFHGLAAIALGEDYEPVLNLSGVDVSQETLSTLAGDYQFGPETTIEASLNEGILFVQEPDKPKCAAIPQTESTFYLRDMNATATFRTDENTNELQLLLRQGARRFLGRRIGS